MWRNAFCDPSHETVASVAQQPPAAGRPLHLRCVRQDPVYEADAQASQGTAALPAPQQRRLRPLSQGLQDTEQPQQSQEHLPSAAKIELGRPGSLISRVQTTRLRTAAPAIDQPSRNSAPFERHLSISDLTQPRAFSIIFSTFMSIYIIE